MNRLLVITLEKMMKIYVCALLKAKKCFYGERCDVTNGINEGGGIGGLQGAVKN